MFALYFALYVFFVNHTFVWCFLSTEEAYQSGQGVLVHCQAGVSRSATVVIAYLMKHTLMTMTDAYKYVRSRRPVVSPNLNFMGQLLEFERDLNSGVTPRILMPKLNGVETQVWKRSEVGSVYHFTTVHRVWAEKNVRRNITTTIMWQFMYFYSWKKIDKRFFFFFF